MGIEIAFAAGQMEIQTMVQLDQWGLNWLVLLQLKWWGLDQWCSWTDEDRTSYCSWTNGDWSECEAGQMRFQMTDATKAMGDWPMVQLDWWKLKLLAQLDQWEFDLLGFGPMGIWPMRIGQIVQLGKWQSKLILQLDKSIFEQWISWADGDWTR